MALLNLLTAKSTTTATTPRGLTSTILKESTDATGFSFGTIVDTTRHQATVAIQSDRPEIIDEQRWRSFENDLVHMDGLMSTLTVDEACRGRQNSRAGVTIKAVGKAQRKDTSELITDLATRASTLHTAAADSGIEATLMNAATITSVTSTAWSPETETTPKWPAIAPGAAHESAGFLRVGDRRSITWEVDLNDPEVGHEITEAITTITFGPEILRWARVFRPELIADSDTNASTGHGRRSGILTVAVDGSDDGHLEDIAAEVMFVLSARTRLRIRRAVGRQQLMALAGLGIGVLGWQHIEVQKR
jgi:hypothetical protein